MTTSTVGTRSTTPAKAASWRRPSLTGLLLVLTVTGFLAPNGLLIAFIASEGFSPGAYFADWVGTVPATQLTVDLVIVSFAFWVWSATDARRTSARWWPVIPATLLVGICFAMPLYLLGRELALARRADPVGGA